MNMIKNILIDLAVCGVLCCGVFITFAEAAPTAAPAPAKTAPAAAKIPVGAKTKCAVTGEDFTVDAKTVQVEHKGKNYAFCCAECQPTFAKNPDKYTK